MSEVRLVYIWDTVLHNLLLILHSFYRGLSMLLCKNWTTFRLNEPRGKLHQVLLIDACNWCDRKICVPLNMKIHARINEKLSSLITLVDVVVFSKIRYIWMKLLWIFEKWLQSRHVLNIKTNQYINLGTFRKNAIFLICHVRVNPLYGKVLFEKL